MWPLISEVYRSGTYTLIESKGQLKSSHPPKQDYMAGEGCKKQDLTSSPDQTISQTP